MKYKLKQNDLKYISEMSGRLSFYDINIFIKDYVKTTRPYPHTQTYRNQVVRLLLKIYFIYNERDLIKELEKVNK